MLWMEVNLLVVIKQVILTDLELVKFLRLTVDISVAFDWQRGLILSMSLFSFIVICLPSLVNLRPINLRSFYCLIPCRS